MKRTKAPAKVVKRGTVKPTGATKPRADDKAHADLAKATEARRAKVNELFVATYAAVECLCEARATVERFRDCDAKRAFIAIADDLLVLRKAATACRPLLAFRNLVRQPSTVEVEWEPSSSSMHEAVLKRLLIIDRLDGGGIYGVRAKQAFWRAVDEHDRTGACDYGAVDQERVADDWPAFRDWLLDMLAPFDKLGGARVVRMLDGEAGDAVEPSHASKRPSTSSRSSLRSKVSTAAEAIMEPTRPATIEYAAEHWFRVHRNTLRKRMDKRSVRWRPSTGGTNVFDAVEVEVDGGIEAKLDALNHEAGPATLPNTGRTRLRAAKK